MILCYNGQIGDAVAYAENSIGRVMDYCIERAL